MDSTFFTEIAVIESLPEGEFRTGKLLKDYLVGFETLNDTGLAILYQECGTKEEFMGLLGELLQRAQNGSCPLLHIECHGCREGIVLANNDLIPWDELKPTLTSINAATRFNLMVVMATCHGALLGEILKPTERAPCWGILGPTEEVRPSDLMGSCRNFYRVLLSELDGDAAVQALFTSTAREAGYFFMTAMGMFKKVYAGYLAKECTEAAYWSRARRLQLELKKMNVSKSLQDIVLDMKKIEEPSFEKYKKKFFMLDLYPENVDRFPVAFSQVRAVND